MIYKRDSIEGPLHAVCETLASFSAKYEKAYCYPSQETIRRRLLEFHGIDICIRTLNYILRWLEDHLYFKRTRRHRAGPDGKILFSTTMYELKKKLFIRLNSMKKWVDRIFPALRVQVRAQYRSIRKNEILKEACGNVEMLLKSSIEGKPSPVSLHG